MFGGHYFCLLYVRDTFAEYQLYEQTLMKYDNYIIENLVTHTAQICQ